MSSKRDGIQKRINSDGVITYRVQVRLRGHPALSATFERRTDARRWIEATKTAIREGRHFEIHEAKRHTLGALTDRWLEQVKTDKPHAYIKEKGILEWWKAELGDYTLADVTPARIAEKRDALLAENIGTEEAPHRRSTSTVNRYLASLSKAFSVAVREWSWLKDNPLRRVSKKTEPPGRVRFLSEDERKRLLEACKSSRMPELPLVVLLTLTTAMRRGEVKGLRWPDVDLHRGLAVLHKTKNRERRAVPLIPQVIEMLKVHGQVRRLDTDFVFPQARKATPIDFDKPFAEAVKAAGIPDFRFHDLRHTAASYLAMSGATTPEIAAVLGHKTLAMVKRYAHLSEQHTGAVVARMTAKYFS